MSDNSLTPAEDGSTRLSAERLGICLESTWEIDALARALPGLIPITDTDSSALHFAVRGIAARILQLNDAVMAGLWDDGHTLLNLQKTVTLKYPEATHV